MPKMACFSLLFVPNRGVSDLWRNPASILFQYNRQIEPSVCCMHFVGRCSSPGWLGGLPPFVQVNVTARYFWACAQHWPVTNAASPADGLSSCWNSTSACLHQFRESRRGVPLRHREWSLLSLGPRDIGQFEHLVISASTNSQVTVVWGSGYVTWLPYHVTAVHETSTVHTVERRRL